jgi:hypothetical protein
MVGLENCNKTLRVLYGKPFPRKRVGIFRSTRQGKNLNNCRTKGKKKNAVGNLPTIRLDSIHLLSGMVHAELSWLFLGRWPADVACPGHGLFFLGRSAVGATGGAAGRAGIVESLHDRVEAVFWQFARTDGICEDIHAP